MRWKNKRLPLKVKALLRIKRVYKMKKLFAILLTLSLMFAVCGCDFLKDAADLAANPIAQAKTFEVEGISIDLTTDFLQMDFVNEDYDFIIGDKTLTIMGEKFLNSETELGEFTVNEFAEYHRFLLEKINPTELSDLGGIPTMQYTTSSDDGGNITAAVMYYKAEDCFWVITFAADSEKFSKIYDDICEYAESVEV